MIVNHTALNIQWSFLRNWINLSPLTVSSNQPFSLLMMKECPLLLSPSLCTEQISSANIYFPSPNDQIGKQGTFISANYRKFLTILCISWTTVESSYFSPEVAEFLRFNITILVLITIHVKFYWFCLWCEAGGGDGRWAGEVEGGGEVCYEVPLFAPWNDLLSVGLLTPPSVCLNIISIAWIIETTRVVNHT